MIRKADQRRFIVRLNLSNPRHQRAWERLQMRGDISYTDAIADALNQQADHELVTALRSELTNAVRMAVTEAVAPWPKGIPDHPSPKKADADSPMSQENYAAAKAFMDGLF